jgi:hypothetical protein
VLLGEQARRLRDQLVPLEYFVVARVVLEVLTTLRDHPADQVVGELYLQEEGAEVAVVIFLPVAQAHQVRLKQGVLAVVHPVGEAPVIPKDLLEPDRL